VPVPPILSTPVAAVLLFAAAAPPPAELPPVPPELLEYARQAAVKPCRGPPPFEGSEDAQGPLRPPTAEDQAYLAIAWDTGLAAVCAHISPVACEDWLFNASGYQVALLRSRCYQGVAQNTGDISACAKVVTMSAGVYDGSGYSPERCAQRVAEGTAERNRSTPRPEALAGVLARHGFGPDAIVAGCERRIEDVRAALAADRDQAEALRERIARSPRAAAELLQAHFFGSLTVPQDERPYDHCRRLVEIAPGPGGTVDGIVVTRRPPEDIAAEIDSHIYAIYQSLSLTPEFRQRIVLPADH
jgi:hypothetical protein